MENGKNDIDKSNLNECYEATQTFKKAFDLYIKQLKKYNDDMESYKRWKKEWNDWKTSSGKYSSYRNHGVNAEFWAKDHDGTCWWGENWNSAHQWCHDMASSRGLDGENYWAKKWGMCNGRHGNFLCAKPDGVVTKQLVEYGNAEPKTDPLVGDSEHKYWLGIAEPSPPQPPSGNNIMCCSQLFKDISVNGGGDVNFSNVIQNCLQKISTKLAEPRPTKPPQNIQSHGTEHTTPTPIVNTEALPSTDRIKEISKEYFWIIIIVVFVACILASCCSSIQKIK